MNGILSHTELMLSKESLRKVGLGKELRRGVYQNVDKRDRRGESEKLRRKAL